MAVGVGTGFDISKFTDALKKADTALTNLVDKQNQLSRVTMNAFKQMSEQGVVPYVESLKKQVSLFDTVKASITDASGKAIKRFGWMKTNIVDATNELNKLINALEKTKQFSGETSGKTAISYANKILGARGDKSIDNMKKALQQLEAAQNRQNLRTKTGQKNYENLAETIRRVKKELDKATASSEKMNKSVGKIEKSNKNLLDISGQLQRRLALVFSVSQISGYINKIVKVRGEFELQQRALQAIVQNVDEANKLWDKTVALAVKSPFRVKELVTYTKQLAAYRIETSKLYDTTKRLADVSAGLGVDMNRLILAYGQVRAANFLRGTELRQFTEAGIPMLEELASYFSELEGRAISVSEVFERISKRMVTFQDVSAVFQRMTNEGGIFYDMQAKQSETLKGQISNLHDSIDLMMNDIGKSNDSILKSLVSTMRTLVDNWKAFATAIEEVGAAFAVIHLARFATGVRIAAAGHTALAISMKGSISIGAKFQKMINTLFATIKAHPFMALSGAIITALYSLYKYNQSIDEANEKYDEMSRTEIRRADALNNLNNKVLENNKAIKDNNKTVEEQNNAIKSNNKILSQIKKDYPELYNAVVKQTDGTIDLTKAIKLQNDELQTNIALQQQAKGSFFQESLAENYKDVIEAQTELRNKIDDVKSSAYSAQLEMRSLEEEKGVSKESIERLKSFIDGMKSAKSLGDMKDVISNFSKYINTLSGGEYTKIYNIYTKIQESYASAYKYSNKLNQANENLLANFENQKNTFLVALSEINTPEERGNWIEKQLELLGVLDEKVREWAKQEIPKMLPIKIDIVYGKKGEGDIKLDDWAIRVKSAIEEVNKKIKDENKDIPENWLFPIPEVGQTKEQYLNSVKPALEAAKAVYREGQKIEDESTIERTNALKPYADAIENILNIQDKSKNNDNDALQRLKEQIRLVRELAKDYQKLWDEQGKDVADASIWSKERIAAFRKAGLDYTKFEVGSEGDEVKNLEKLTDISGELYKAIADARTELGSFKQQLKDAEFARYLDELFGNYEVSLELEKLNIPPDLAKRLFGVESIDLNSIRKEILNKAGLGDMQGMTNKEIFSSERYLKLNKEQRKIVEDGLKKEDELQQKALEERLKRYSQFLVKGQSERVRIKIEELRELEKLEEDYQNRRIDEGTYKVAKENIKKESKEKQDKIAWEEFKDSDMYIRMFEDLESASNKSLATMKARLVDIKDILKELSPTELKEIAGIIEKLDEQMIQNRPFKGMISDIKEYFGYIKEKDLLESLRDKSIAGEDALRKRRDEALERGNTKEAQNLEKDIKAQEKQTEFFERQIEVGEKAKKSVEDRLKNIGSQITEAANSLPQVAENLENVFGVMDAGTRDTIESIAEIGAGVGSAIQGFASGDYVQGILGVTQAISGIFKVGDKAKEREIQSQIKLVDKLGKQYEKLEKQIDEAYSIDQLKGGMDAAKSNMEQQLAAYDNMIAAEEDKKKTDKSKIEEWKEAKEELTEQYEELQKEQIESMGGTYDYKGATREFVEAWIDAFNETGNGLDGLTKHFQEWWKDILVNQAVMKQASKIMQPLLDKVNESLEDYTVDDKEQKDVFALADTVKGDLDDYLKGFYEKFGSLFTGVDDSGLSGLQRGIQGITESQADILASYLNSIRFYVSENNSMLSQALDYTRSTNEIKNPMEDYLMNIAEDTKIISSILTNVQKGVGDDAAFNVRVIP